MQILVRRIGNIKYAIGFAAFFLVFFMSCQTKNNQGYTGKEFSDEVYKQGAQVIPGKLECEYYDRGGEGVAFHDSDTINSGSGNLNKPDGSYLHEFRKNEAVDISYTKYQDQPIDNTIYNFAEPGKDHLYVGWTKPGEWVKYTVNVAKTGDYRLGIMYTSNKGGKISFSVNDADVSGPVTIPSTYVEADTVAWRQWHHWNYLSNIARVHLTKGIQTFTIHTVETGEMNYDFIDFKPE